MRQAAAADSLKNNPDVKQTPPSIAHTYLCLAPGNGVQNHAGQQENLTAALGVCVIRLSLNAKLAITPGFTYCPGQDFH